MLRSAPQLLLTVLILGLLLAQESRQPPLAGLEEQFASWLAANASAPEQPAPLALVEIDDDSLGSHPWPWSPLDYALFLEGGLRFQAAVAAIEPVLAWDGKTLSTDARFQMEQTMPILHERILQTPKLLPGAVLGSPEEEEDAAPRQPQALPALHYVEGSIDGVPEFTSVGAEPDADIRLATGLGGALGFTNLPGADHGLRRAPLLFRYHGQIVPSFVLQGLMLWYGLTPDDVRVVSGKTVRLGNRAAIPIDRTGAMLVDWKAAFTRAPIDDFLLSVEQMENGHAPLLPAGTFRGKMLLLARTDAGAEKVTLASGERVSTGEFFAEALATAQTGEFVRPAGWAGDAAAIAAALGLGALLMARPKPYAIPLVLAFVALYLAGCLMLFESFRIAMPLTLAMGLALFAGCFRLFTPNAAAKPAA